MIRLDTDIAAALRSRKQKERILKGQDHPEFIIDQYRYGGGGGGGPLVYNVPNNNIAGAFVNTTNFVWDTTRGYYVNSNAWDTTRALVLPMALNKITKVTVTSTGYYDTPSGGMGQCALYFVMSNATIRWLGTSDGNTSAGPGQYVGRGDLPDLNPLVGNVIDQVYTWTIPGGITVSAMDFKGCFYPGYPAANRGLKNIIIEYNP